MIPIVIKVRGVDPAVARCIPGGETASCTSDPAFAASRAAAKHFRCGEDRVKLIYGDGHTADFLALPASEAPANWRSATQIVVAAQRARGYPV